jgi:hypothetical protein
MDGDLERPKTLQYREVRLSKEAVDLDVGEVAQIGQKAKWLEGTGCRQVQRAKAGEHLNARIDYGGWLMWKADTVRNDESS